MENPTPSVLKQRNLMLFCRGSLQQVQEKEQNVYRYEISFWSKMHPIARYYCELFIFGLLTIKFDFHGLGLGLEQPAGLCYSASA